ATDVTGFGLIGHLQHMARSSGVAAEVWSGAVPVLDGVAPLVEEGLVPGGTRRNEAHFSQFVAVGEGVGVVERTILFDAQTYGGMVEQCHRRFPDESCGGLGERDGVAKRLYPLNNAAASPVFYSPDDREMIAAIDDMDEHDLELLGIYHSHVATRPYPSPTDV